MFGQILTFLIILLSASGLVLSFHIFEKKRKKEKMVCPLKGTDCNAVIGSDYSRFLGTPVEILGIVYYFVVLTGYVIFAAAPNALGPGAAFALFILSLTALLFSIYLTFIQAVVLKEWCSWCLSSAVFCAVIFSAGVFISNFTFIELLAYNENLFTLLRLAAVALGVGAATIGDIFFLLFLKDFKISVSEAEIIRWFGEISWVAILGTALLDTAIYLPNISLAEASAEWNAQFVILIILMLNAAFFYLFVSPKLVSLSFSKKEFETREIARFRKWAFGLAAFSLTSWYFLLALSSPVDFGLRLSVIFLWFAAVAFAAVFASQIAENYIARKANS